jgi:glutathionylspermidine synthase
MSSTIAGSVTLQYAPKQLQYAIKSLHKMMLSETTENVSNKNSITFCMVRGNKYSRLVIGGSISHGYI